jgi:hypothetical protein
MNKSMIDRFVELEKGLATKRGPFALFALFAREDLPDRWDLIVAAPWAQSSGDVVKFLVSEIKSKIGPHALSELSRIVVVKPSDPPVRAINQAVHVQHGNAEVRDSNFFGLPIKHAFIITSQGLEATTAK